MLCRVLGPQGCPGEEIPDCSWKQEEEGQRLMLSVCPHWCMQCQVPAFIQQTATNPCHLPAERDILVNSPLLGAVWEGSWQGSSSLLHKLDSRTYHEVQLLLDPRVKSIPVNTLLAPCSRIASGGCKSPHIPTSRHPPARKS